MRVRCTEESTQKKKKFLSQMENMLVNMHESHEFEPHENAMNELPRGPSDNVQKNRAYCVSLLCTHEILGLLKQIKCPSFKHGNTNTSTTSSN